MKAYLNLSLYITPAGMAVTQVQSSRIAAGRDHENRPTEDPSTIRISRWEPAVALISEGFDRSLCEKLIAESLEKDGADCLYPSSLGEKSDASVRTQLAIYLIERHLKDLDSLHCDPLPESAFALPWDPQSVHEIH
ncbi:unnamed protein product [Cyprideis torosa]|uniref:Uncharacterized protein n=1 Tax=Cyprideis torosa TaxID=163714 RepID=A0A7R8ZNH5_9CRUS|nr:unnamed protein product [Cyprideis torosa]CAG0886363.1 unnamed protein product [Cyprideis torosa]